METRCPHRVTNITASPFVRRLQQQNLLWDVAAPRRGAFGSGREPNQTSNEYHGREVNYDDTFSMLFRVASEVDC